MDTKLRGLDQVGDGLLRLENLIPIKKPADKTKMFRTLLKGQALYYFEHHIMRRLEA
jgi:hypothetical protein